MLSFSPSFFDHLSDRLQLAVYDTKQELRQRRLTKLLRELESVVKKRRLTEAAFVNGAMREPGYVFDNDGSAGPHRRSDSNTFAYHPQFEDIDDTRMSAVDRIKSKALQARGVVPRVLAKVEAGLDEIIGEEPKLNQHSEEAFAPHLAAIAETKTELDGIKTALDLMSNGGPALDPLPESGGEPKA